MKKDFFKACILGFLFSALSLGVQAQDPPNLPPPPPNPSANGNGVVGGLAPIGSGLGILLGLGLAYGATKVIRKNSEKVISKNSEEE
jgi:hypothetical protein